VTKKSYETVLLTSSILEIGLTLAKAYPKFPRYLEILSELSFTAAALKKLPSLTTIEFFKSVSENSFNSPDKEIVEKEYFSPSSTSILMISFFLFGVIETSVEVILKLR